MTKEEALQIITDTCKICDDKLREACAFFIPELKESEDERIRNSIIQYIQHNHPCKSNWIAWLEKQDAQTIKEALRTEYEKGRADAIAEMQKPVWSEEDERIYRTIIHNAVESTMALTNTQKRWLKSLKDRVQPQSKQEWSEEDEKNRDLIYAALNKVYDLKHNKELCDWFNHLKYYPCWKLTPSQLSALEKASNDYALSCDELARLSELYEQLKKL